MKKIYFLAAMFFFASNASANVYAGNSATPSSGKSPQTLAGGDVQLLSVKLTKFMVAGDQTMIKVTLKNNGTTNITSVELNWNDGTGDHKQRVVAYLNVGQQREIAHPVPLTADGSVIETKNVTVTVTQVNDGPDTNPADNTQQAPISIVSQSISKKVIFEEGTGTWCGWCPRGMVALDAVNQQYPDDQISIAVHNNDPMVLAPYNAGAAFSGFPGMNVDRELKGVDINPNSIGNYVTTRKQLLSPAQLTGDFSITGSTLSANVNAKFLINNPNTNYRLAVVIVEDGVKGTANGYRQSNYYSGGGNGPMGGFENLPNPVPAAQMVYDHVGRALLGGYNGEVNSVPAAITDGQNVGYTFEYTVPAEYIKDNIHAVLLLIDSSDGTILDGAKLTKTNLAVNDTKANAAEYTIYPNPAKTDFNLKFPANGTYTVTVYDMNGREVKNSGAVNVMNKTALLTIKLLPGKYFVNISKDGKSVTKDLLVK
ncbi:Omp28-related outer membrane protein [Kaistella palustris]|uniref:Omp28-related outer membrane protein n=1 Tax=Kaistella palustris TaxID=493376 RepID=UPI00042639BE|nr:Omp28-related outer membrane protein [Kaistella palustris]